MKFLIDKRVRRAGMIGSLAAAVLLLPLKAEPLSVIGYSSAWAGGERGGIGDQVKTTNGYSNYLATEDPVTPCRSCYAEAEPTRRTSPATFTARPSPASPASRAAGDVDKVRRTGAAVNLN